jgi:hypothetical protein
MSATCALELGDALMLVNIVVDFGLDDLLRVEPGQSMLACYTPLWAS